MCVCVCVYMYIYIYLYVYIYITLLWLCNRPSSPPNLLPYRLFTGACATSDEPTLTTSP